MRPRRIERARGIVEFEFDHAILPDVLTDLSLQAPIVTRRAAMRSAPVEHSYNLLPVLSKPWREVSMHAAFRSVMPALLVLAAAAASHAQPYPAKPVRIVVGFAAGGPTEVAARLLAQKLAEKWGQPVVVDARTGAGGNIATEIVAKAPADGYTLLVAAFAHAVNPALYANLPFDTGKDFAPVALLIISANVLAVHPSLPARSVRELVALAKAKPGALTYGSAGIASASHLAGELLNSVAGIRLAHVPYKGAAPASVDLVGGHISAAFPGISLTLPHAKAGRLRLLGVTGLKRSDSMPELPTIAEAGVAGFEVLSWYGLLAPAGTPAELVARLNQDATRGLREPDSVERVRALGAEAATSTPAEFGAYLKNEMTKWAKVVRFAGIQAN
jgi:tripartite-type tricarboxylate transporter receptor subunit TctC